MAPSDLHLPQRLTAFTCTVDDVGRVLMVRYERLGVVRWELPGGHIEPGETAAAAAARETSEETGAQVKVGRLVAECRHHWRSRSVGILYFHATPDAFHHSPQSEPRIHAVEWITPSSLDPADTSALCRPVIDHVNSAIPGTLHLTATHHQIPTGWEPTITHHQIHPPDDGRTTR